MGVRTWLCSPRGVDPEAILVPEGLQVELLDDVDRSARTAPGGRGCCAGSGGRVAHQAFAGQLQQPLPGRDVAGQGPLHLLLQDGGRFMHGPRSLRRGRRALRFSVSGPAGGVQEKSAPRAIPRAVAGPRKRGPGPLRNPPPPSSRLESGHLRHRGQPDNRSEDLPEDLSMTLATITPTPPPRTLASRSRTVLFETLRQRLQLLLSSTTLAALVAAASSSCRLRQRRRRRRTRRHEACKPEIKQPLQIELRSGRPPPRRAPRLPIAQVCETCSRPASAIFQREGIVVGDARVDLHPFDDARHQRPDQVHGAA